ncbi:hypothetical protein D4R86_00785 [bacterium]|nr:MAG: hypothetical protein D4R86_00785 [bacterium]
MTSILSRHEPEDEEQREVLTGKTQNMIEESFFKNLKLKDKAMASKIGEAPIYETVTGLPSTTDTEKLLLDLFEVRDGLIQSFESVGLNTTTASNLSVQINKLGSCIRHIGGEVVDFAPLEHISGLQMPDLIKSAQRVVDTTKQCYTLGKITKADVEEDGKIISINFEGKDGDIAYVARGTITANSSWKGNEAIDYIYTRGEGRMSVKAFENNRWVNRHNDYNVYWELDEVDTTVPKEKVENKKEISVQAQNKVDSRKEIDEQDIDNSFPIEEN